MKAPAFVLILFALSACEDSVDPALMERLERQKAEWDTLEDGSVFARIQDYERSLEVAMRCWPDNTGLHMCVSVVKNSMISETITVSRHTEASLPEMLWGLDGDGYRCQYFMGDIREEISVGDPLISNRIRETGKTWSATFVDNYMAKNDLTGPKHFRCLDVLKAVMNGSLRTLGTTTITRAMAV